MTWHPWQNHSWRTSFNLTTRNFCKFWSLCHCPMQILCQERPTQIVGRSFPNHRNLSFQFWRSKNEKRCKNKNCFVAIFRRCKSRFFGSWFQFWFRNLFFRQPSSVTTRKNNFLFKIIKTFFLLNYVQLYRG